MKGPIDYGNLYSEVYIDVHPQSFDSWALPPCGASYTEGDTVTAVQRREHARATVFACTSRYVQRHEMILPRVSSTEAGVLHKSNERLLSLFGLWVQHDERSIRTKSESNTHVLDRQCL